MKYLARKTNNGYAIFEGDMLVPSLHLVADGRGMKAVACAPDSEFASFVEGSFPASQPLASILATLCNRLEAWEADCKSLASAEIASENAWLKNAEYDPEADEYQHWEDMMGIAQFEDVLEHAFYNNLAA